MPVLIYLGDTGPGAVVIGGVGAIGEVVSDRGGPVFEIIGIPIDVSVDVTAGAEVGVNESGKDCVAAPKENPITTKINGATVFIMRC